MPTVEKYTPEDILSLMYSPTKEDSTLIIKAFNFAERAHAGHQRFSGEPYFNHLVETAKGLAKLGLGPKTIAAGLLHDSIEDAKVKPEDVEREFGKEVLFLIEGVTKLGHLKYRGLERHTESLRKLLVATSQDLRVLLIKLMDRLHNMRTLASVPEDKRRRIALETLEIYAPIAHRLGIGLIRRELEDLAFQYVYPKEYEEVKVLLREKSKETEKYLEKFTKALKRDLAENGLRTFTTSYRIKGFYSLFQKLQRKENDMSKIYDIAALRLVVPTVADCYKVLGIIHAAWRPLPNKIKDYIAFPKPNGYQSIHTTVFTGDGGIVEIQIRTEKMQQEAEYGIASHLLYKEHQRGERRAGLDWLKGFLPFRGRSTAQEKTSKDVLPKDAVALHAKYDDASAPLWVRQMADVESAGEGKEFLDKIKADFFSHRVFVFTPKGDVVDLPIGASPIDFAYAIHSDIGNHLSGAKVNGKLVTLDTELHNGDIVEIVTKEAAKPSRKWLEFAKTALAQKQIRTALSGETRAA